MMDAFGRAPLLHAPRADLAWECHARKNLVNAQKLFREHNLDYVGPDISDCKARCNGVQCFVIAWHESDQHCLVYNSSNVTRGHFTRDLVDDCDYTSCFLTVTSEMPPSPPPPETPTAVGWRGNGSRNVAVGRGPRRNARRRKSKKE